MRGLVLGDEGPTLNETGNVLGLKKLNSKVEINNKNMNQKHVIPESGEHYEGNNSGQ